MRRQNIIPSAARGKRRPRDDVIKRRLGKAQQRGVPQDAGSGLGGCSPPLCFGLQLASFTQPCQSPTSSFGKLQAPRSKDCRLRTGRGSTKRLHAEKTSLPTRVHGETTGLHICRVTGYSTHMRIKRLHVEKTPLPTKLHGARTGLHICMVTG